MAGHFLNKQNMISIDRVYKTLLMLANSDIRGNIKPSDLRLALYDTINEIVEEYFYEVNRLSTRESRGFINGGLENLPDRIREKILYFYEELVQIDYDNGYYALPNNLRYIDSVFYKNNQVEFCKSIKEFNLLINYEDTKPTDRYPIGLQVGNKLRIYPSIENDEIQITFLRKPLFPNWTYVVIDGSELFNPSAIDFQDIDLHPSEENKVVLMTLKRFGINLKEQDLMQITSAKESSEFNQDNVS